MSQQIVNIGRTANDKSGDPLRVAFDKVNHNFDELYIRAFSASGFAFVSDTPPADPAEGLLWYNTTDGNQYIYFNDIWVPTTVSATGGGTQLPSDWNATSGVTRILNKPLVPTDINQLSDIDHLLTSSGVNLDLDGGSASTTYDSTDLVIDGNGA